MVSFTSRVEEANKLLESGHKHLETALLKWTLEHNNAATQFQQAALGFKRAGLRQKAIEANELAIESYMKSEKSQFHAAKCMEEVALLCRETGDLLGASKYFLQAMEVYRNIGNLDTTISTMSQAAKVLGQPLPASAFNFIDIRTPSENQPVRLETPVFIAREQETVKESQASSTVESTVESRQSSRANVVPEAPCVNTQEKPATEDQPMEQENPSIRSQQTSIFGDTPQSESESETETELEDDSNPTINILSSPARSQSSTSSSDDDDMLSTTDDEIDSNQSREDWRRRVFVKPVDPDAKSQYLTSLPTLKSLNCNFKSLPSRGPQEDELENPNFMIDEMLQVGLRKGRRLCVWCLTENQYKWVDFMLVLGDKFRAKFIDFLRRLYLFSSKAFNLLKLFIERLKNLEERHMLKIVLQEAIDEQVILARSQAFRESRIARYKIDYHRARQRKSAGIKLEFSHTG